LTRATSKLLRIVLLQAAWSAPAAAVAKSGSDWHSDGASHRGYSHARHDSAAQAAIVRLGSAAVNDTLPRRMLTTRSPTGQNW